MIGALQAQMAGQPIRDLPPVTRNDMIAYFPDAWNFNSEFLESSFQDIPVDEPELVRELLRPWPQRSLLFRLYALKDGTAGRRQVVWNANSASRHSSAESAVKEFARHDLATEASLCDGISLRFSLKRRVDSSVSLLRLRGGRIPRSRPRQSRL